jgi:hypothetical protein
MPVSVADAIARRHLSCRLFRSQSARLPMQSVRRAGPYVAAFHILEATA